jgi:solute carrier family 25 protein 39/40
MKFQHNQSLNSFQTFACGASAGSLAAFLTCPLDVVKTHRQVQLGEADLQKDSRRTFNVIKEIYRVKGVQGLFAGEKSFYF